MACEILNFLLFFFPTESREECDLEIGASSGQHQCTRMIGHRSRSDCGLYSTIDSELCGTIMSSRGVLQEWHSTTRQ